MSTRRSKSKSKSKSSTGVLLRPLRMLQSADQVGAGDGAWPRAEDCVRAILNETIHGHVTSSGTSSPLTCSSRAVSPKTPEDLKLGANIFRSFYTVDKTQEAGGVISAFGNPAKQASPTTSDSQILGFVQLPDSDSKCLGSLGIDTQESTKRPSNSKRTSTSTADTITKRTRSDPGKPAKQHGGDEDDDGEEGSWSDSTVKPVDRDRDDTTQALLFACPYFRLDPVTHQNCLGYKLKRIRDVKQHLHRRHTLSPFYCPTCFKTFPSMTVRDDHIRSRDCTTPQLVGKIDNLEGVSQEAQGLLKERVNRTVKPADQWYAVWEILFGDSQKKPIDGPFIGSMVRETFRMVRAFWRSTGSDILPRFLKSQAQHIKDTGNLQDILYKLFHEVETQFDTSLDLRTTGSPCPSTISVQGPSKQIPTLKFETLTESGERYSTNTASPTGMSLWFDSDFQFDMVSPQGFHDTAVDATDTTLVSSIDGTTPPSIFQEEETMPNYFNSPSGFEENWPWRGVGSWDATSSSVLDTSSFPGTDFAQQSQPLHYPQQLIIGHQYIDRSDFEELSPNWDLMSYVTPSV